MKKIRETKKSSKLKRRKRTSNIENSKYQVPTYLNQHQPKFVKSVLIKMYDAEFSPFLGNKYVVTLVTVSLTMTM